MRMSGLRVPVEGPGCQDRSEHATRRRSINQPTHVHPPIPPKCRPIQPKPSFLGALHPMGLHVGRNNDQDRDLIATNRGNCTTRVSDTPTTCRQQASCSAKPPSNTNSTNQPGQLPHKQTVNNLCTPPDPNSEHPNRCTLHTRIGCADADRLSPRG